MNETVTFYCGECDGLFVCDSSLVHEKNGFPQCTFCKRDEFYDKFFFSFRHFYPPPEPMAVDLPSDYLARKVSKEHNFIYDYDPSRPEKFQVIVF